MIATKTDVRKDVQNRMRMIREKMSAITNHFEKKQYYDASYVKEKAQIICEHSEQLVRLAKIMMELERKGK